MPKKSFCLCFVNLLLIHFSAIAFPVKGIVLNDETQQPVAYVNIGVVNKNIGTVSGPDGRYALEIPEGLGTDSLRFSGIGYTSRSLPVAQVKSKLNERQELVIDLMPQPVTLQEIRIGAIRLSNETVGGKSKAGNLSSPFLSPGKSARESLGAEKGVLVQSKKYPASLQHIRVHFSENEFDSLTFRINVYAVKDGLPYINLVKENILFYVTNQQKGWISFDLMEYNLEVKEECIVTLEWLDYRTKKVETAKKLVIAATAPDSATYTRLTSQHQWEKTQGLANLQVTLAY